MNTVAVDCPRTWTVLGDKLGDNAQVLRVAGALGWPWERRELTFRRPFRSGKPPFMASLYHVQKASSDALRPPWPDLILTGGRRPAMAALWIRGRARRAGAKCRVVLFGRPKCDVSEIDLVVAPPQYDLPVAANVMRLSLPLLGADPGAVERAGQAWEARLGDLPRPLTAVLLGGATQPFRFDAAVAEVLVRRLRQLPGTLYVTTSRRTGVGVVDALRRALPDNAPLFEWRADGADNPYLGLLAHADQFVVSGDSVSMAVEVARLGKPLAIFELPRVQRSALRNWLETRWSRYSRDLGDLHQCLYADGHAVRLGEPFGLPAGVLQDETAQVVQRIWQLMDVPGR